MNLIQYFNNISGHGVLATADSEGRVDVAIYARPHIMDENTIAFIMPDRLTHHNLQSNPHAAYLFLESGEGLAGKRLFLTKVKEEKDSELLYAIRKKAVVMMIMHIIWYSLKWIKFCHLSVLSIIKRSRFPDLNL